MHLGIAAGIIFVLHLFVYPLTSMMQAGFFCEVLREHGIIADENAELVEENAEAFALHNGEGQNMIAETNEKAV